MVTVTTKYTGKSTSVDGITEHDWLNLAQEDIPQNQQICTLSDLKQMMDIAALGQAARAYKSEKCPIKRRIQGDKVIIIYDATILVRRSASLAGNYDLIPSEGTLSLGQTIQRAKSESYTLDYQADLFLGWLPIFDPQISWRSKVKNIDKIRVFAPKIPEEHNGYIYWPEAYRGSCEVAGQEILDKYILPIEHQQGYKYDKTVLITAEWGLEDIDGNRQSVQLEVKPPQCWIDEANKCAADIFAAFGQINDGDGGADWNVNYGPITKKVWIGPCSGKILKVENLL